MIPTILITALLMGYGWHRAIVQRDAAIRLAVSAMAARGRAERERDQARAQLHPSGRLAPVASVTPIRKGELR